MFVQAMPGETTEVTIKEPSTQTISQAIVWATGAGVLAAWLAAGSAGFFADQLRISLSWLALMVATVCAWPQRGRRFPLLLGVPGVIGLRLFLPGSAVQDVLFVAIVLAALAVCHDQLTGRVLTMGAFATLALALFRLACATIPLVWWWADTSSFQLGRLVGTITGHPLDLGATFAGLDFLVLMLAFMAGWVGATERPRWLRAVYALLAILGAQLAYLALLSFVGALVGRLPAAPDPGSPQPYIPPPWSFARAIRPLFPWNVPALAAILQLGVLTVMLRWSPWKLSSKEKVAGAAPFQLGKGLAPRALRFCPFMLALLLPLAAVLTWNRCDLSGKKIVANLQGHVNWDRPSHNNFGGKAAGRFGMLPVLVESLGGTFSLSSDFSAEDLAGADMVLWLQPAGTLPSEQYQRVWDFVRGGGSLLVAAEPFVREGGKSSCANDLLQETTMQVQQEDLAVSSAGNWHHACFALAHPATAILQGKERQLFTDNGTWIQADWPARPLVVGRWGWSEPGSNAAQLHFARWDGGERLGDLVLAAEQRCGQGTVVVLADSYSLTNEGSVRGYEWTGRLLSYLANRPFNPQHPWRQLLALGLALGLLLAAFRGFSAATLVGAGLLLAGSLGACERLSLWASRVVPDGRLVTTQGEEGPYRLAYVDASHLEAYHNGDWGYDGINLINFLRTNQAANFGPLRKIHNGGWGLHDINGLALTLMRNGYLPAAMPEISPQRLERADLVISIAPARSFSSGERDHLKKFVERGGIFICTVGAEEARASESLLKDFGWRVPASPVPTLGQWHEPEPMGRIRTPYLRAVDKQGADYELDALFFTGWPVEPLGEGADILVRGKPYEYLRRLSRNKLNAYATIVLQPQPLAAVTCTSYFFTPPIVGMRTIGQGRVIIIGDPGFALNKNLESSGGEPFEGRYENAHFWRWLLARLKGRPEWTPPRPPALAQEKPQTEEGHQ